MSGPCLPMWYATQWSRVSYVLLLLLLLLFSLLLLFLSSYFKLKDISSFLFTPCPNLNNVHRFTKDIERHRPKWSGFETKLI